MTIPNPVNQTNATGGAPPQEAIQATSPDDELSPFEQEIVDSFVQQAQRNGGESEEGADEQTEETEGGDEVEAALAGEGDEGDEAEAAGAPASTGQEGTEAQPPVSTTPVPSTPPEGSEPPPPDDGITEFLGRPRSEIEQALQMHDWARSLPPEALQGIDAYLSGQYVLVPADQVAGGGAPTPATTTTTTPSSTDDFLDDVDPDVARRFREQQERLDALEAQTQATVQSQQQQQQDALLHAIEVGGEEFKTAKNLTDDDLQRVMDSAAKAATLTVGMQLYRSDPKRAVIHALDLAYLSDPDFRQREIDRRAAEQNEANRALAERKRRAGSVTSAGGSVPKPTPTPPSKMTAPERDAAMAAEVAAAMANR